MNARNLGFVTSWHMLTRDKGWIKPVLVLTLVGWVPILGQIVLLGYGLEWARLTAWGVDSAPKQRGVDYGKVLSTGGRAYLVSLSLGFVVALVLQVLFPGSLYLITSGLTGGGVATAAAAAASGFTVSIVTMVATLLLGSFLQAAALRATLYDSFSAGWRLDRLFQMIGRDFGGFLKTLAVTLIGGAISGLYTFVVAIFAALLAMGGVMGVTAFAGISGDYMNGWHAVMDQLLRIGAGPLLLLMLLIIGLTFVGGVITTAMSLVSMNAMGQWFCRFDVNRWGVSSDPLPADVPHHADGSGSQANPAAPVQPIDFSEAQVTEPDPQAASSDAAEQGVQEDAVDRERSAEVIVPLDAPVSPDGDAAAAIVDEAAAQEAAEAAAHSMAEELKEDCEGSQGVDSDDQGAADAVADEPACERKPIPLGPVSSDSDEHVRDEA